MSFARARRVGGRPSIATGSVPSAKTTPRLRFAVAAIGSAGAAVTNPRRASAQFQVIPVIGASAGASQRAGHDPTLSQRGSRPTPAWTTGGSGGGTTARIAALLHRGL